MNFDGLRVENNGDGNVIEIDPGINFSLSRITINGDNNYIRLGVAKSYHKFALNFKGDDKLLEVNDTTKNINNFKFTSIRGSGQKLSIGKDFSCGGLEVQMNDGDELCKIGDNCLFSWGIKIRTSDGHSVVDLETGLAVNMPKDVTIKNRVWVGEDVSFLKGSSIATDCIVGSRSVVTKVFTQKNCVVAGFPASIVKEGVAWDYKQPSLLNEKLSLR